MPEKTPGKFVRGNPTQKSWQNVWRYLKFKWKKKRLLVDQKSRMVQQFTRGCATKNPWQIAKPENLSAKATQVACIVAANKLTKEPLGSVVVCQGQDPGISPSKLLVYNCIVNFHFSHNTYRIFFPLLHIQHKPLNYSPQNTLFFNNINFFHFGKLLLLYFYASILFSYIGIYFYVVVFNNKYACYFFVKY